MAESDATRFGDLAPSKWPGERLGLPAAGPGSIARFGRRAVAIIIDWILAVVIGNFTASVIPSLPVAPSFVVLGVFAIMQILFIPTLGGSIGHLLCGMRVVPLQGGWIGVWRPVVRTLLLCIVIPVIVWDSDQRAFHDKIPGTVLILTPERS